MSTAQVHLQAMVAPGAKLAAGVRIGAYAVVGEGVQLGENCVLHPHAVLQGPAQIGSNNVFYPFCSIGGDPQDWSYQDEPTELAIGDGNTFREYVTVNRGTIKGGGRTTVGSGNLFLASSHIGHDCLVGDHTLLVNGATLAGHVTVEDFATIGFSTPVHQFCRVGRYAYIGASSVITKDVPPFALIVTERETKCYGVNTIGLERQGFSAERVKALESAFRLLLRSKLNTSQALEKMRSALCDSEDVRELIQFIETAERGILK